MDRVADEQSRLGSIQITYWLTIDCKGICPPQDELMISIPRATFGTGVAAFLQPMAAIINKNDRQTIILKRRSKYFITGPWKNDSVLDNGILSPSPLRLPPKVQPMI